MTIKITKELLDRALERYAGGVDEEASREAESTISAMDESINLINFMETIMKRAAISANPAHGVLVAFAFGLMVGTRMAEDGILEWMVERG